MTKKLVKDYVSTCLTDCYTIGELLEEARKLVNMYGAECPVNFDSGYSSLDENIQIMREETEKEYQKRLKDEARERDRAAAAKLSEEAKELKEYERLKKKFGQ
jgi:hypothetical protein